MGRIYHRALAASESKQGGIVVTWVRVPQYESSIYYIDTNLNTFQVALEYDGTITLSYLTLTTSDGVCVCVCVCSSPIIQSSRDVRRRVASVHESGSQQLLATAEGRTVVTMSRLSTATRDRPRRDRRRATASRRRARTRRRPRGIVRGRPPPPCVTVVYRRHVGNKPRRSTMTAARDRRALGRRRARGLLRAHRPLVVPLLGRHVRRRARRLRDAARRRREGRGERREPLERRQALGRPVNARAPFFDPPARHMASQSPWAAGAKNDTRAVFVTPVLQWTASYS